VEPEEERRLLNKVLDIKVPGEQILKILPRTERGARATKMKTLVDMKMDYSKMP